MEFDFSIIKVFLGTCKIRLNPIRLIMDPDIVYNGLLYNAIPLGFTFSDVFFQCACR